MGKGRAEAGRKPENLSPEGGVGRMPHLTAPCAGSSYTTVQGLMSTSSVMVPPGSTL